MYDAFLKSSGLSPDSMAYVDGLYELYLQDASQLPEAWVAFFDGLQQPGHADQSQQQVSDLFGLLAQQHAPAASAAGPAMSADGQQQAVWRWIEAYRLQGCRAGDYDPLGFVKPEHVPALTPAYYGLSIDDKTLFDAVDLFDAPQTVAAIEARLKAVYSHHIGCESMHIHNEAERAWLAEQMTHATDPLAEEEQKDVLQQLALAEGMEQYLGIQYVGQKRFSLEGAESFIVFVDGLIRQAVPLGLRRVVMGMAHRGRLNTLVNVMGMDAGTLCAKFAGSKTYGDTSGDVKYHLGHRARRAISGETIDVSLAFNPSHLEAIVPVVMGMSRSYQDRLSHEVSGSVMPILVHGDAAISGQGVVMESLNMSKTPANNVHGSVHVVINNQVGFTMSADEEARSSEACTDIAKVYGYPVFHVHGDDPEAVLRVARMASAYRMRFKKSVFVNLVSYRRHGHNEADEPAHTQPMMYAVIRKRPTTFTLYAKQLSDSGVLSEADVTALKQSVRDKMAAGDHLIDDVVLDKKRDKKDLIWDQYLHKSWQDKADTSFPKARFKALAKAMAASVKDVDLHRQIAHLMKQRADMTEETMPVRWGYAETMAYATLMDEGYTIRLMGEDAERGTFAHRHAVVHDVKTGEKVTPLHHIPVKDGQFNVYNSSLSEFATMGFEYGYAITDPKTLVIWEAQFGDFANGAQVIIDQFLSSGWQKWQRLCGLVLFLPHGYEGMGPEHSSARLERFLQLCAQHNLQVCVPSNAAQIFHLLRRQMKRAYRKPLVVMTPKSLLRLPAAMSPMSDVVSGSFQTVIVDDDVPPKKAKRILLCSGKSYYDLKAAIEADNVDGIVLMRIEQLYPFPYELLKAALKRYASVHDVIWCQEEPRNQGAWYIKRHCFEACLSGKQRLSYAGRARFAAPACGYPALHKKQQALWVAQALGLEPLVDEDHE